MLVVQGNSRFIDKEVACEEFTSLATEPPVLDFSDSEESSALRKFQDCDMVNAIAVLLGLIE